MGQGRGAARWLLSYLFILSLPLPSFFSIFIIYRRFIFSECIPPKGASFILFGRAKYFNCWYNIFMSKTRPLRAQ